MVSFAGSLKEEHLLNVPKPLPKQLWETKEVGEQCSAVFVITGCVRGHCEILQGSKGGIRGKAREFLWGQSWEEYTRE
uniref:CREB regulated transcription coactivator 3 n=1 Tax=Molossus molossus TaxID=27622 RepID=A0A7J8BJY4_MOLMO|nr:CREB regulated transcription coactivator 3 [Molossus molossus]